MKSRKWQKSGYAMVRRKIIMQMAVMLTVAIAIIFFIRLLTSGRLADPIVTVMQRFFKMDYYSAVNSYRYWIGSNQDVLMLAAIAVFFFVLMWFLISRYSRYFNEINRGIDALIKNEGEEISMSPEMEFMKDKLIKLRRTLEDRERAARDAEQKKNDLVMYLAHDIKTPLTSVIGYLSLLNEARDMPTEQREKYTGITLDKAYRLEKLINEFFEIARYNLQAITLAKEDIDLTLMLEQLADEAYPQLTARGKTVCVHTEDIILNGDADKLARVFNNILKNAITYGDKGSGIEITAGLRGDMAVIQFINAGSIPNEKLHLIFEKFHRLDDSRGSELGGSGLGLSIAKEIVTLHGGNIYAKCDDNRTMFTVELPAGIHKTL